MSDPAKAILFWLLSGCGGSMPEETRGPTPPIVETTFEPTNEEARASVPEDERETIGLLRSPDDTSISIHSSFEAMPDGIIDEVPSPTPVIELLAIEFSGGHGAFRAFEVRLENDRVGWVEAETLLLPTAIRPVDSAAETRLLSTPRSDGEVLALLPAETTVFVSPLERNPYDSGHRCPSPFVRARTIDGLEGHIDCNAVP